MRVDGGAAANDLLMQFQSDVGQLVVERPSELSPPHGSAAMLAGASARGSSAPEARPARWLQWSVRSNLPCRARAFERLSAWTDAVRRESG
jgi:glycerol kinase